jgi:hypothetical protein
MEWDLYVFLALPYTTTQAIEAAHEKRTKTPDNFITATWFIK